LRKNWNENQNESKKNIQSQTYNTLWFLFTFLDNLFKLDDDKLCETLNFYAAHATSRCNAMPNAHITNKEVNGTTFSPNEYATFNPSVTKKYGKVAESELASPNGQYYVIVTLLNSGQLSSTGTKSNQNYKSKLNSWICAHEKTELSILRGRELYQIHRRTLTYKWA